jgi:hypothetical protein
MERDGSLRWYVDQGLWSFRVPTPYEFLQRSRLYTLEGVVQRVTCPVLVCEPDEDHFNPGQARKLAAALGERATLRSFTAAESAGVHAHPGAWVLMNGVVFDWLAEALDATLASDARDGYRDVREPGEAEGALT